MHRVDPAGPARVEASPDAVRAALSGADRAAFESAYAAALAEAGRTFRLEPVHAVVVQWRLYAMALADPANRDAVALAVRFAEGEELPVTAVDWAALR